MTTNAQQTKTWKEIGHETLIVFSNLFLIALVRTIWSGWAIATLWNWFATLPPLNAPHITWGFAAGIVALVAGIRMVLFVSIDDDDTPPQYAKIWFLSLVGPPIVVVIGALVRLFT